MICEFESFIDNELIKKYKANYQKIDNKISFNDDETNDIFTIEIIDNENINITRKGDISMKFKFILNKKTVGIYKFLGNIYHFDIYTSLIDITNDKICLIYKMIDNTNKEPIYKINIYFCI